METLSKFPQTLKENPAKKSLDSVYFDFNRKTNKVIGRAEIPTSEQGFFSKINKSEKENPAKKINIGSPMLTNKKEKLQFSPFGRFFRRKINQGIGSIEKVYNFTRQLSINNWFNSYLIPTHWGTGNRDIYSKNFSKQTGGLTISHRSPISALTIGNFIKTVIDKINPWAEEMFDRRERRRANRTPFWGKLFKRKKKDVTKAQKIVNKLSPLVLYHKFGRIDENYPGEFSNIKKQKKKSKIRNLKEYDDEYKIAS